MHLRCIHFGWGLSSLNRITASADLFIRIFSARELPSYNPPSPSLPKEKDIYNSNSPVPSLHYRKTRPETHEPIISYWYLQSQPSLVRVKSPQAIITDHHKHDFSFLPPTSTYKVIIQWPPTRSSISKQFWLFWSAEQGRLFLKRSRTTPANRRKLIRLSFTTGLFSTNQHPIINSSV